MNKIFNIDGVEISLPEELCEKAYKYELLDKENYKYNEAYLENCIRSEICTNWDEFGKFSMKDVVKKYTNEEIVKIIENSINNEINDMVIFK